MNHKPAQTILTTLLLVVAMLQAPYFYYCSDGLLGFLNVMPYMFLGFALTVFLLLSYRKYPAVRSKYNIVVFGLAVGLGFAGFIFGEEAVEWMDWHLRFAERNRLIKEVKVGKLKPNVSYNNVSCRLPRNYFPPISNGGNEICIQYGKSGALSVEFFIDRGFLDHYQAFLYTEDEQLINHMDNHMAASDGKPYVSRKLAPHWYRVSY